jgi:hypothetical protein
VFSPEPAVLLRNAGGLRALLLFFALALPLVRARSALPTAILAMSHSMSAAKST